MSTEQDILKRELSWGAGVAVAVGLLVAVVVVTSATMVLHPPSNVELIDPARLHLEGEFTEQNLGTVQNADGSIAVRLLTTQFAFVPRCFMVPANTPVTLRVTSPDVIHGLIVAGTNVNTMVIPGYVSEIKTEFRDVGDHIMPCHEYCGLGHSEMWAMVRVVPKDKWKLDAEGRARCEVPG